MAGEQRSSGRRAILSGVRRAGRIARIDLAERTGVSAATVTTITGELIREGLIEEVPRLASKKSAGRGRPRVDLKIQGKAHHVAGMKISSKSISTVISDFEGTVIADDRFMLPQARHSAAGLAECLHRALKGAAHKAGIGLSDLSALGVGLAGIIDAPAGLVHWSPSLERRNVGFRDILSEAVGMPVFLDNDANLVAMAEQYFGLGRDVSDFIVVTIESGVGMGIILKNEVYRGTRGCGAEFGHTKVQLDGALCRCGQRGCLEAYVADYALLREAAIGTGITDGSATARRVQDLILAARSGDPLADRIIGRARRMFAMGLANVVNIFDPQLIILSGESLQFDYLFADEVIGSMRQSIVQVDVPPPEVVIHKWGDRMWAVGAAAFAIEGVSDMALKRLVESAG